MKEHVPMEALPARYYFTNSTLVPTFQDLAEMMEERGSSLTHTTIMRLAHQYGSELDKQIRHQLKQTNDSRGVDETYIKVK